MKIENEIKMRAKQAENAIDECTAAMHDAFCSATLKLIRLNETIEDRLHRIKASTCKLSSREAKAFDNLLQATLTSKKTCGEITEMLELLRKMKAAYTESKSK